MDMIFNALVKCIKENNHQKIKEALEFDDAKTLLETRDKNDYTLLMWACKRHNEFSNVSLETTQLFVDAIRKIGGDQYLKYHLSLAIDFYKWNCLCIALISCQSNSEIVPFLMNLAIEVGGDAFLLEQLQQSSKNSTLSSNNLLSLAVSNKDATYEMMVFFVSKLYEFEIFELQFTELKPTDQQRLKGDFCMWQHWTSDMMIPFGAVVDAARHNDVKKMQNILHNNHQQQTSSNNDDTNNNNSSSANAKTLLGMAPEGLNDQTILLYVCQEVVKNTVSISTLEWLLDEIITVAGNANSDDDFFADQLTRKNAQNEWNTLMCLCAFAPSPGFIAMYLEKVIEFGDRALLKRLVGRKDQLSSTPALALAVSRADYIGSQDFKLLVACVAEVELFKGQYHDELNDDQKKTLRQHVVGRQWLKVFMKRSGKGEGLLGETKARILDRYKQRQIDRLQS